MVTIVDEKILGEFSGETEREALKALRAARRAEKKQAVQRAADAAQARLRACAQGLRIHEWLAEIRHGERDSFPHTVRLARPETESCCAVRVRPRNGADSSLMKGHRATYEVKAGRIAFDHVGYYVEAVLEGGSGLALAVVLRDTDEPERRHPCAVGSYGVELVLVPLTITLEELEAASKKKIEIGECVA